MENEKKDKVDGKAAVQFLHPAIWNAIKNIEKDTTKPDLWKDDTSRQEYALELLETINELKQKFKWEILVKLLTIITKWEGRVSVMEGAGRSMLAGEIKYGSWTFLEGRGKYQLLGAMERHALRLLDNQIFDYDSSSLLPSTSYSISHTDCIAANISMLVWLEDYGTIIQDGPIKLEKDNGIQVESTEKTTGIKEASG